MRGTDDVAAAIENYGLVGATARSIALLPRPERRGAGPTRRRRQSARSSWPALLLEAADELERASTSKTPTAMPGQASQSSNDEDWSMAVATSSVHMPVKK
jgi:hypothetical protein